MYDEAVKRTACFSRETLRRSVASSTAVETREPIEEIERMLERTRTKYEHITLALKKDASTS